MTTGRFLVLTLIMVSIAMIGNHMDHTAQANSADASLKPGVDHDFAKSRAANYGDVKYALNLEVMPGAERLRGSEQIYVKLKNVQDLVIDWRIAQRNGQSQGLIKNVRVNGKPVSSVREVAEHIVIPSANLKAGENTVDLEFESPINTSGSAVTRYLDKEDGSEYIYTLFVPSDASTTFPCFDQPDLKARFSLQLTTKEGWQVVANTAATKTTVDDAKKTKSWQFVETEPISTYLFAFAVGPFAEVKDEGSPKQTHVYVRKSKLEQSKSETAEVFHLTRECITYFEKYFDFKFPFPKYDLVLIPEFAYGGMEHAGATFLREDSVLFPSTPTSNDKLGRAQLIFHETAHQWFGDLVTMKWFDDLWLKEGFATFMAYKATEKILPQYNTWKAFYQRTKPAAYQTDATKGTTPIWQEIPNLSAAKSAYGNIVYNKAPSMLHQAEFYLGNDEFQRGVQMLVKEHAYGNAEWADLVHSFEKSSGEKLDKWADAWVKTRGMPDVRVLWRTDKDGLIDNFMLHQTDVLGDGGLWPMRVKVLLYYDSSPPVITSVVISSPGGEIFVDAIGKPEPSFVFANYEDYGYGRFLLDEKSRQWTTAHLGEIKDEFLRALLWGSLWDSVREAEMPPADYLELGIKLITKEQDEVTVQSLLGHLQTGFNRYLSKAQQQNIGPQLEKLISDQMLNSPSLGLRITYFRAFQSIAQTDNGRDQLKKIVKGEIKIPEFELKSRDKFDIVTQLLAADDPQARDLLDALSKEDKTDNGRRYSYASTAAQKNAAIKKQYFQAYIGDPDIPESWIEASLGPFNTSEQNDLTYQYLEPALQALPQMKRTRKIFFVNRWLGAFIGGQCTEAAVNVVDKFLNSQQIDRDLRLKILESADGLNRCVKIRSKYAK